MAKASGNNKGSVLHRMGATKRDVVVSIPLTLVALAAIGYGVYGLIAVPPYSWMLVLAVFVGVILCGPLRVYVGRGAGFPIVGASIALLLIYPIMPTPQLSVCVWVIALAISELRKQRVVLPALHTTGVAALAAGAAMATFSWLINQSVWIVLCTAAAIAVYYLVALLGMAVLPWGGSVSDLATRLRRLSPVRILGLIIAVTLIVTAMQLLNTTILPSLEAEDQTERAPFIVLLTALFLFWAAQRGRSSEVERQLRAIVDAAVEFPLLDAADLPEALVRRAKSTLSISGAELRETKPGQHEIGAAVHVTPDTEQYLVAVRRLGGLPFAREDERALVTLAYLASEAARKQSEVERLEQRANSDPLTGLPNFRAFQAALADANENRRYHEGIAVLFLDLDDLKTLNETKGHQAGDEALKIVAERLRHAAGGGDFVARVGGDEFVVILRGMRSLEAAKAAADEIVSAVNQAVPRDELGTLPRASAGLAFSSHRELNPQALVEDADRAMLRNRRSRPASRADQRSTVGVSSHHSTRTNALVARAIHDNRLSLAFQPIVSIDTGKIWAFEALVRYVDPELGPITPPSLVARAKSLGLLNELTKQVVTKALDAAEEIRRIEPSIETMTVNFEVGQICEEELRSFIRESALAYPDVKLCVELNEHSLRSATDALRNDAKVLQEDGVIIALDDYGSDESSVGALVHFPMDVLKIDKSLISNLADVRQREIIAALQSFGDKVGNAMIVEGVETQAMFDTLLELGVRNAQGYYFGRPITLRATLDRLRRLGTQAILDS